MRGIRCEDRLHSGVTYIGLRGEASCLIEEPHVEPVSPPILQAVHRLLTNVEGNALFRHFAARTNGVTQLIDDDRVVVSRQRLFIAFQRIVARSTRADKLETQPEGHTITGRLADLVAHLDDRIFITGSDEAIDEGLSQGLYEETLGPQPHRKRMVGTELSHCHEINSQRLKMVSA
jgi:hypothetical protein